MSSLRICLQHHRETDRGFKTTNWPFTSDFQVGGCAYQIYNCQTNKSAIFPRSDLFISHSEIIWSERDISSYGLLSRRALTDAQLQAKWYQLLAGRPWVAAPLDNGCVLSGRRQKGILVTLSSCSHAAEVLSKRSHILGKHSIIQNVSLDKPIVQRL